MPGKPAARLTDPTTPPHLATLVPGPGAVTVLVGNRPAWRCNVDTAICPTLIAPPAPAPHGPEICVLGSLSVMIGGQMAVRVGDNLIGAGGPNPVLAGEPTVLIGDVGFGLANPANMAEFCKEFAELKKKWSTLTPEERRKALESAINKQLGKSGLPAQTVNPSTSFTPGNAQYDFQNDKMDISAAELNSPNMTDASATQLANTVYHESRHAEQWFLMARQQAGGGATAIQLASGMGITPTSAAAASSAPLVGEGAAQNLASTAYTSVYGPDAAYRNGVLNDVLSNNTPSNHAKYTALPEEQDAWHTGDSLPCGAPSP